MRDDLRHFIDVSMNGASAQYELLGDGITAITEDMNAEEETKHYIHQKSASSNVKGYQRTFEIDKEDCVDDAVQTWIDGLVDTLPVGAAARTSFIRLRIKDAVSSSSGTYKAIKVPCTVTVGSNGGDAGDFVHNTLTVKQSGDDIPGTFNVTTKTFTATN